MRNFDQVGLFAVQEAEEEMKAKAETDRLAAEEKERNRDLVGERLIAAGFAHNDFLLNLNRTCGAVNGNRAWPDPWNLPSRIFQWPIHTRREPGRTREIWMSHPDLDQHPAVLELKAVGFEIGEHPFPHQRMDGEWQHGMDLATEQHWQDLLRTLEFTSPACVSRGVEFQLEYRRGKIVSLKPETARKIMLAVGHAEPSDRLGLRKLPKPSQVESRWPINAFWGPEATWAIIHGIEDGHFVYSGDFLGWSPKGRETYSQKVKL